MKLIDTISEPGSSRLLVNTDVAGIGNQVLSIIRNEPVKEITIVSPYYDNTGSAIAFFSDNLHPDRIVCLGDEETGTWPVSLREGVMERVDFRAIKGKELETRTHAKIIQIHTDKSTYLLSGSANATSAGLGLSSVKNDEAIILIQEDGARDFIADMGITAGEPIKPENKHGAKEQANSKSAREATILSCELWNGSYLLKTDISLDNVQIHWKDALGNDRSPVLFDHLDKSACIKYDEMPGAVSVVLKRDECAISNRILILAALVLAAGCSTSPVKVRPGKVLPAWQEGWLDIHSINGGRGESFYYIFPDGTTMLVDAAGANDFEIEGPDGSGIYSRPSQQYSSGNVIVRYLGHFAPEIAGGRIDYMMISHYHSDHMGGYTSNFAKYGWRVVDKNGTITPAINLNAGGFLLNGLPEVGISWPIVKLIDRGDWNNRASTVWESGKGRDIVVPGRVIAIMVENNEGDCTWEECCGIYLKEYLQSNEAMDIKKLWF